MKKLIKKLLGSRVGQIIIRELLQEFCKELFAKGKTHITESVALGSDRETVLELADILVNNAIDEFVKKLGK